MALSRGYTVSWGPHSCAMPMNTMPKLYRWSCWGFAVRGRRTRKPRQPNYYTVLPCGHRENSSPLPPPNAPTTPISRPGWGSTLENFGPYQHTGMPRHPLSFSRTWPSPRMYIYVMVPSGEPSKPRMSAHTGSSTGTIRAIQSRFRVLRRQSPLTAWSRRMSSMLTQNPLHHRPFLPVSRLAPDGGYAFRITWRCSGLSGGEVAVWWTPLASPPT